MTHLHTKGGAKHYRAIPKCVKVKFSREKWIISMKIILKWSFLLLHFLSTAECMYSFNFTAYFDRVIRKSVLFPT